MKIQSIRVLLSLARVRWARWWKLLPILMVAATTTARCDPSNAKIIYHVSPPVRARSQPNHNACWATAATMLLQWQADKIKSGLVLQEVDIAHLADLHTDSSTSETDQFESALSAKRGLGDTEKRLFIKSLGLELEWPANYTVDGWVSLIKDYGPLWATAVPDGGLGVHAYVITGVEGEGTYENTFLQFIDPISGKEGRVSLIDFTKRYERAAINDMNVDKESGNSEDADLRIQIVHASQAYFSGFPKK